MPQTQPKGFLFPLSRRARRLLIFLPILLLICLVILQCQKVTPPPLLSGDRQIYHQKIFNVLRVVDGDTIIIDAPDPDNNHKPTRVRLIGVDTPETVHPRMGVQHFGPEASQFTTELVETKDVTVALEPQQPTRDRYRRLLAYIYLADDQMLNELLIAQGYAYAEERFPHVFRDKFIMLQTQAQDQNLGLWQNDQPSDWPQWYQRLHPEQLQQQTP